VSVCGSIFPACHLIESAAIPGVRCLRFGRIQNILPHLGFGSKETGSSGASAGISDPIGTVRRRCGRSNSPVQLQRSALERSKKCGSRWRYKQVVQSFDTKSLSPELAALDARRSALREMAFPADSRDRTVSPEGVRGLLKARGGLKTRLLSDFVYGMIETTQYEILQQAVVKRRIEGLADTGGMAALAEGMAQEILKPRPVPVSCAGPERRHDHP